jgi:hypothetical protein
LPRRITGDEGAARGNWIANMLRFPVRFAELSCA